MQSFLENALRIYDVPKEKIAEAIEFVKQFDYPLLAQKTIDAMFAKLEQTAKNARGVPLLSWDVTIP